MDNRFEKLVDFNIKNESVDIWLCPLDEKGIDVDYYFSLLSSEEQQRCSRFKFAEHQQRFKISHCFMRIVLSDYLKVKPESIIYCQGEKGKPFLDNHNLTFNLSHSNELALLAIGKHFDLGVDIEYMERNTQWEDVSKRFYTPSEQKALFSLPKEQQKSAFYQIWTRKEAYIKALGVGLSLSPDKFSVSVPPQKPELVEHFDTDFPKPQWAEFNQIPLPPQYNQYCACCCTSRNSAV